jgi:hypothetical protein
VTSAPDPESSAPPPRAALGGDFIIPALACGLTGYYFASTVELVWEAKATGIVIGVVLVALCAAQFVRLGLRITTGAGSLRLGELIQNDLFNRQRLGLIAMVALFVVAIHWLGATLGLFLLLIGCMRLLGVRRLRTLVGVALVTAAVVHLVLITLLDSRLPRGVLKNLLAAATGGS